MKYGILILIVCFFSGMVSAQQKPKVIESIFWDDPRSPIVWVDSMRTDMNHLVMDKADIDSISLMKDSADIRYGQTITRGSMVIVPKPGVELIRWSALLDRLSVPPADRQLRVCINKTLVRQPAVLLLQPDFIRTIEITTEHHWLRTEDANSKELFLNIITKDNPLAFN